MRLVIDGRHGTGAFDLVARTVRVASLLPHEREDAYQAGFLALEEATRRFDPGRGVPFNGYAYRWVRGAVIKATRRGRTAALAQAQVESLTPVLDRPDKFPAALVEPGNDLEAVEEAVDLARAVRRRSDKERELLHRLYVIGETVVHVAAAHEVSRQTIHARKARLLADLRKELEVSATPEGLAA